MAQILSDNIIINNKFPSVVNQKDNIIKTIINSIKNNSGTCKINYEDLYLIIDEALTNAMEHGNKWDPKKTVAITITKTNKNISITIEDEGCGFNINQILEKDSNMNMSPRGRGIKIIKHFCRPNWNLTGNKINFCIDIK